jgi:bifunctional NMN adenylyltransferase/nudix hydrolase
MTKRADLAVFIGRFSPFHLGHRSVVLQALDHAEIVAVLVGSSFEARDFFTPFEFKERERMVYASVPQEFHARLRVRPVVDFPYNDTKWTIGVQDTVNAVVSEIHQGDSKRRWDADPVRISLIGHSKDHSSFYLKKFPQWTSIEAQNYAGLSATPLRSAFFSKAKDWQELVKPAVSEGVLEFLEGFKGTPIYRHMVAEFDHIRQYRKPYEDLIEQGLLHYPPIFSTVDAVVIQSGHVLLVERRAAPGKGLWALPGGFLNQGEWVMDGVIRELYEETKIKVPEAVVRGSFIDQRQFDAPNRSARGRTITTAAVFNLAPRTELPKVRGADDAKRARWWPIADVRRDLCFEDHYSIIDWAADVISQQRPLVR